MNGALREGLAGWYCFTVVVVSNRHHTLILLRHAKSAYSGSVDDHDRPLAPRGVREAGLAGDWLRANLPGIDAVLCSTATRARQTLSSAGIDAPVRYAERLYDATPGVVVEEITTIADDVATVLVIGHEPAISAVALGLAGADETGTTAAERIAAKFPTSAIAVLRVPGNWKQLKFGDATLVDLHVPR